MGWHIGAWTPTPLHTSIHQALWSPKHAAKSHALAVHNTWPHTYVAVRSEVGLGHPQTHVGSHATSRAHPGKCVVAHSQNWTNLTHFVAVQFWPRAPMGGHVCCAHGYTYTSVGVHGATWAQALHVRWAGGGTSVTHALRASVTPKRIMHTDGRCRARLKESGVICGRTYTICTHALCDMGRWTRERMGVLGVGVTCCVGAHNA